MTVKREEPWRGSWGILAVAAYTLHRTFIEILWRKCHEYVVAEYHRTWISLWQG